MNLSREEVLLNALKIIVLSQDNRYSRTLLEILENPDEYALTTFLTADFFANIDKYSSIVKNSDIVFLDLENIPLKFNAENSIKQLLNINPDILLVTTVSADDRKSAISSLLYGAFHYFTSPINASEVFAIIEKCNRLIERSIGSHLMENSSSVLEKKLNSISDLFNLRKLADSRIVLNKFFNMVIDSIISIIKCDKCSILFLDETNGDILVQNSKNKRVFSRGPATVNVLATKAPQIIENVSVDKRFTSIKKRLKYKTSSFLNVPVFHDKKMIAVVNVTDKVDGSEFSVEDLEKIRGICLHVEEFIQANYADFKFFLKKDNDDVVKNVNREKKDLEKSIKTLDNELNSIRIELEARKAELGTLYAMGKILKTTFAVSDLLKMIIEVTKKTMECRRASVIWIDDLNGDIIVKGRIGSREKDVEDMRIKKRGSVTNFILKENKSLLYPSSEYTEKIGSEKKDFNLHKKRGYMTDSFIAVPLRARGEIVAIINITDKISGLLFNDEDLNKLEFIAGQLSTTIENFKLSENLLEKERISKELEIAHRIQARLLPKSAIDIPGLEISVMNFSALEMGGDYFDFVKLSDRFYGICIGDVAGKGVPASLQMMILRTLFRHLTREKDDPAKVIEELNRNIINDLESNSFISFMYAIYDAKECRMAISNAGNCYPAHYSKKNNDINHVEVAGLLLGIADDATYNQVGVDLGSGDILAFYTDGIFDVANAKKEMWGEENFMNLILKNSGKTPDGCIDSVMSEISLFKGEEKQFDDMTLIIIKKK